MDRQSLEIMEQALKDTGGGAQSHNDDHLQRLVDSAQRGDEADCEQLLQQFRPLMRSRMHRLWSALCNDLSRVEWDDVEAHVRLSFLTRLDAYRPDAGVYFAHYMRQMLDIDCRDYLRQQRRQSAVPFSQVFEADDVGCEMIGADEYSYTEADPCDDDAARLEQSLSMRSALDTLTELQRDVVWRCCVLGEAEARAAAHLGISRSAVRNRLEGALTRMRNFFQEDGSDSTAQLTESAVAGTTRTGRSTGASIQQREWWIERIEMAKNEKRPDLVGVGMGRPILLQGVFEFEATGLKTPQLLSPKLRYTVPDGYIVGIRYVRVGVSCDKMVCISTVLNGDPHRLIPVAANGAQHVALAIVEPICAGSQIEIHVASEGSGTAIIDVGCLQIPA
jgi:RNA polymerase sigma factor (sigma-70 family)